MLDATKCQNNDIENEKIKTYYVEEQFDYTCHLDTDTQSNIKWKRVIEICEDPCLLDSHDNYNDGYINCGLQSVKWFPVLFTMLRCNNLFNQVIRDIKLQDNYSRITYDGSFIFSFYGRNQWTDVRIDDRLPFVSNGSKSLFAASSNKEEFLPSLLEKAYARYLGGYAKVQTTTFIEAVMHFTGGIIQEVPLRRGLEPMTHQEQKTLFMTLRSQSIDTLVLCHTAHNQTLSQDFVVAGDHILSMDHYYLVKGCTSVPAKSRSNVVLSVLSSIVDFNNNFDAADLVRLHNPVITGDWGGSYNHGSQEWESMSENVRRHYDLKFDHEFEFWISINDMCKNMSAVLFCHIPNDRRMDALLKSVTLWHSFYECGNYGMNIPDSNLDIIGNKFLLNDQYLIDVTSVKEVTMKAVLQVDNIDTTVRFEDGCGVIILKVENNRCYRLHDVNNSKPIIFNTLSSTRSTFSMSLNMLRGRYILLPWRHGKCDIRYYLRMYFTHRSVSVTALTEDKPPFVDCFTCSVMKTVYRAKDGIITTFSKDAVNKEKITKNRTCTSCVSVNPADAIRITMIAAENLELKSNLSRSNSYYILKCGNYSYKSSIRTLTNNPLWNDEFLFFRVDQSKEIITVELFYEETFGFDKSLGIHSFNQYEISRAQNDDDIVAPLSIICDKELVPTSAKIRVRFKSYLPSQFINI